MTRVGSRWNRLLRFVVRRFGALRGGRLPARTLRWFARLGLGPDALIGPSTPIPADIGLGSPLGPFVKGLDLGAWALGVDALDYVQACVRDLKPSLVIEFGSGVSSAVLALALRDLGRDERPLLVSIEQSNEYARHTTDLLERAGLAEEATVVVAPLRAQTIEGRRTTCYDLPDLANLIGGRRADLIVIDGPAAEEGARFGTLPLVRPFVGDHARFVLDDALRDGELKIAQLWSRLGYVQVDEVRVIGKGLLTGSVSGVGSRR